MKKFIISALLATIAVPANAETPDVSIVSEIQREVNLKLTFQAERDGQDVWNTPLISGRGDCEDFALLKQKMLIEAGWDPEDLKIIIVYRKVDGRMNYEGHTVLYIKSINTILDSSIDGDPKKNIAPEDYKAFLQKNGFSFFCVVKDTSKKRYTLASDRCSDENLY